MTSCPLDSDSFVLNDGVINEFLVDDPFVLHAQSVQATRTNPRHIVGSSSRFHPEGGAFQR